MNLSEELGSLYKNQRYEEVLARVDELESQGAMNPSLLVYKSMCIRLIDENPKYPLEDAKSSLYKALEFDIEYVDALTELGWYYLNVEDDAKQAMVYFQQAANVSRAQFVESVGGVARCMAEIGPNQAAVQYYTDNVTGLVEKEELDKDIEEIQEIIRFDSDDI
jgi:tetratricopeptide (TPR) repeat protein